MRMQDPPMSRLKSPRTTRSVDPEALALEALVYLAEDHSRLSRFLAESGMQPGELAAAAADPATLCAVLDYLVSDESLLLVFADHAQVPPETIEPARQALANGPPSARTRR